MNQTIDYEKLKIEIETLLLQIQKEKSELETMFSYTSNLSKYGAICYTQQKLTTNPNGEFIIKYPYEKLPNNGLLFVVPQFNSIKHQTAQSNKLIIKFPQINSEGKIEYSGTKIYSIITETSEGRHRPATSGDIIANRMAIFRFITGDDNTVILINNPQYNDIQVSTLHVTNSVVFDTTPLVNEDSGTTPLATTAEVIELSKRVEMLENKFQYGTQDVDSVLYNAPAGTIYIKLEDD